MNSILLNAYNKIYRVDEAKYYQLQEELALFKKDRDYIFCEKEKIKDVLSVSLPLGLFLTLIVMITSLFSHHLFAIATILWTIFTIALNHSKMKKVNRLNNDKIATIFKGSTEIVGKRFSLVYRFMNPIILIMSLLLLFAGDYLFTERSYSYWILICILYGVLWMARYHPFRYIKYVRKYTMKQANTHTIGLLGWYFSGRYAYVMTNTITEGIYLFFIDMHDNTLKIEKITDKESYLKDLAGNRSIL